MASSKKEEALKQLETLDEKVLVRLADLSKNSKAIEYFKSPLKYGVLKGFLK